MTPETMVARRAALLRGGPVRSMPLATSPGPQQADVMQALAALAGNPGFADSLGLGTMATAAPGKVPSYGDLESAGGYEFGSGRPNIERGLPPQTISAAADPRFAGEPFASAAPAAAQAPSDVAAAAAVARNDNADPGAPDSYASALAPLAQLAKRDPEQRTITYSHGRLEDQPWFDDYVKLAQQRNAASDEQRAQMAPLPTVRHTGGQPVNRSYESFKEFYNSDAQIRRRSKRDSGIARAEAIANSPSRQRAMRQAAFRDNPQLATLESLQQLGGGGNGNLMQVGMLFGPDAMGHVANAQAAMANHQMLAQDRADRLALQQQMADAQAASQGIPGLIAHYGGAESALVKNPGAMRAEVLKMLASNSNSAEYAFKALQAQGVDEGTAYRAVLGNLPEYTGSQLWAGREARYRQALHNRNGNGGRDKPVSAAATTAPNAADGIGSSIMHALSRLALGHWDF